MYEITYYIAQHSGYRSHGLLMRCYLLPGLDLLFVTLTGPSTCTLRKLKREAYI